MDLAQQIRERLAEMRPKRFGGLSPDRLEPIEAWIGNTEAALLAVLRLHPAETHECPGEDAEALGLPLVGA